MGHFALRDLQKKTSKLQNLFEFSNFRPTDARRSKFVLWTSTVYAAISDNELRKSGAAYDKYEKDSTNKWPTRKLYHRSPLKSTESN